MLVFLEFDMIEDCTRI